MRYGFSELQNGAVIPNGILWFTHVRGGHPYCATRKSHPTFPRGYTTNSPGLPGDDKANWVHRTMKIFRKFRMKIFLIPLTM